MSWWPDEEMNGFLKEPLNGLINEYVGEYMNAGKSLTLFRNFVLAMFDDGQLATGDGGGNYVVSDLIIFIINIHEKLYYL